MRTSTITSEDHHEVKVITTTKGPVDPGTIKKVLMYERLYGKIEESFTKPTEAKAIELENLHEWYANPLLGPTNVDMLGSAWLISETKDLTSKYDCNAIVDVANDQRMTQERAAALKGIDLAVIVGTTSLEILDDDSSTNGVTRSAQELAKELEGQIRFGIEQSKIPAGIIGPLKIRPSNDEITNTNRYLEAVALAQVETLAAVYLDFESPEKVEAVLSKFVSYGGIPAKTVCVHAEKVFAVAELILNLGFALSFNMIGLQQVAAYSPLHQMEPLSDKELANGIQKLLRQNPAFISQILLSNGIYMKTQLQKYGGGGFSHVLGSFTSRLCLSPMQVQTVLHENPVRLLSHAAKREAKIEIPKDYLQCHICQSYFAPIEGTFYSKFNFTYCKIKCLSKHSKLKFA